MLIHVAFTGTPNGLTELHLEALKSIDLFQPGHEEVILHHGACKGADRQAHRLVKRHCMYPSNQEQMDWAVAQQGPGDLIRSIEHPLERNKRIVDAGQFLVACPSGMAEKLRSGTWATIRYAWKVRKRVWFVYPSKERALILMLPLPCRRNTRATEVFLLPVAVMTFSAIDS